ncbi:DUF4157 domain-containing protein [Dyella japonica]|uniref:eCIS core domain-containing protein n=1 Tax=Dyella japonica TaxID=231455 RepID=UPI00069C5152|nr:DUF4157 domain-containing protein [Dyella japonica]
MLQRKPVVLRDADRYEREADRLADRLHAGRSSEGAAEVTRIVPPAMSAMPADVAAVTADGGAPLPAALRQEMEQGFGHNFSHVRVHTGARAEASAALRQAQAYTVGSHIVFGPGRFAPASDTGRHLLAHELTHVLQQRSMPLALQRQPVDAGAGSADDAGQVDASADGGLAAGSGSAGSASPATPAAPPTLPTRVPSNEAEAIEDTATVYPTSQDVTAAIAQTSPLVQSELGNDIDYQRKFLYRCSLYLGPHPHTVDHFKDIVQFKFADGTKLSLHKDTMAKLEAVQAVIGAKNMPSSGTGFALRSLIRQSAVAFPGMMVHAMGYAIDFRAGVNPHIKDDRLVAVQALYTTDATTFHQSTGAWRARRDTIRKMGTGELGEDAKVRKDFLAQLHAEGQRDLAGNQAITHELPDSDLAELKSLRTRYKDYQKLQKAFDAHLKAAKKKAGPGVSFDLSAADLIRAMLAPDTTTERGRLIAEAADVSAKRAAIVTRTREILHGLIDRADADIRKVSKLPHVTDTDKDYRAALDQLGKASATAKRAVADADRELSQARRLLDQHVKAEAGLDKRIKSERNDTQRTRLQTQRATEDAAKTSAIAAVNAGANKRVTAGTQQAQADAKLDEANKAKGRRTWLQHLEDLQRGLSDAGFDARLVFGIGDADAEADRAVRNPSLVQLFSRGFFNIDAAPAATPVPVPSPGGAPTTPPGSKPARKPAAPTPLHGFDLNFIEEMAKHGFDQGTQWDPGGVDSMHFENVEGVDALHTPTDAKRS